MPGIGVGIGIPFRKHEDESSYWTTSNIVVEGHSFVVSSEPVLPLDNRLSWKLNRTGFYSAGVTGSSIADVITRAAVVDTKLVVETDNDKNILLLWIGLNDVAAVGSGLTAYNALKPYVTARIAAGWKVFVFNILKATAAAKGADFEAERVIFNNLLNTDLASNKAIIVNVAGIAQFNDPSDTDYFNADGLHLTDLGRWHIADYFAGLIQASYPLAFSINDISGLCINGTFTKDEEWQCSANNNIADGVLHHLNNGYYAIQDLGANVNVGDVFRITWTCSNWTGGRLAVGIGGVVEAPSRYGDGTFVDDVTVTSKTNNLLYINQATDGTVDVDNVSVVKL